MEQEMEMAISEIPMELAIGGRVASRVIIFPFVAGHSSWQES